MNRDIHQARIEEAPLVAALVAELLAELGDVVDLAALTATTEDLMAAGDITALLALSDGQPVGVVTLHQCAAIYAGGRFGEISELYVVPEQRSSGLGRDLIDAASAQARAAGWTRLEVGAPEQPRWQRTRDFYLANGFSEVGPRLQRTVPQEEA